MQAIAQRLNRNTNERFGPVKLLNAAAPDDYTYDPNGNLTHDLNKGIGINLTDATNLIRYNFLNLPETVTKGSNSVRYIYDATGRKLAQTTTFGTRVTTTDYAGEFVYEDDVLQFIQHEEGRIVVAQPKPIYHNPATALTEFTPVVSTVATVTQSGSDYIRATVSGTTAPQGLFPIGGTITVQPGERYRIRAKGYRVGTSPAAIMVKVNNVNVDWPGAALPLNLAAEAWAEQTVTIPAGAANQTLQAGVMWNTVAAGHTFHLNEFEIIKLEATAPEYQYHLKDHLGNTRLTFTSKEETESTTATLETAAANAEQSQFLRYANARKIYSSLFNHSDPGSPMPCGGGPCPPPDPDAPLMGYAQRLNGSTNEKFGLAKSLSVMPGDKINIEVYAKYVDPNSTNWTGVLPTLMSQIAGGTAGLVIDGAGYGTSTSAFPFPSQALANTSSSSESGPKAYLNWLVFDKDYQLLTGGFDRLSINAREFGQDVAHERLFSPEVLITEPGYVYVFLSNEETAPLEVFFDDFKVTHTKGPVIQTDDYYAFGLTFNSYQRENSVINQFTYNGKEHQDELNLGWLDYGWRMYQPELTRWGRVDNKADQYYSQGVYNYVANNPLIAIDPDGNEIIIVGDDKYRAVVQQALIDLAMTPEGSRLVESLIKAEHVTVISMGYQGETNRYTSGQTLEGQSGSWIHFDPNKKGTVDGVPRIPFVSLGHELRHSEQDKDGLYPQGDTGPLTAKLPNSEESLELREVDAVNNSENKVRAAVPGAGRRNTYTSEGNDGTMVAKNIKDVVIDGRTYKVKSTDYSSFKGKAAQDKFIEIRGRINSGKILRNVNKIYRYDELSKTKKYKRHNYGLNSKAYSIAN